jgi:amino acid transporter
MSTVLKGVTSAIIYTPLALLILFVLFIIGYGVEYYTQTGDFPSSYKRTLSFVNYIVSILLIAPLKSIGQLLWFIFPFFPSWRENVGYSKWGAWDSTSNNRQFSLVLVLLSLFMGISIYIYNNGYPDTIADYSYFINYIFIGLGVICLTIFFIKFTKMFSSDYPSTGTNDDKNEWLSTYSSKYLYILISLGVTMGILAAFAFLVSKNILFNVSGTIIIMIGAVLSGLFLTYKHLIGSVSFQQILNKNPILNVLFYAIFIIPCIFFDIVKYLYNEFRHTPQTVYYIFAAEMVLITLLIVAPIFVKFMYTNTATKDNKQQIIDNKIKDAKKSLETMNQRVKTLKKNTHSENGKRIPEDGWANIKRKNLNNPDNREELVMFLINYGYRSGEMCDNAQDIKNKEDCKESIEETIRLIHKHSGEIFDLEHKISETSIYLEQLKKEYENVKKIQKAKVLLRKPVYLKNKHILGRYDDFKTDGYDIQYNYNYAISAWFFIRAQPPNFGEQYRKHTTILDYGGKPTISYNGLDNSLKIKMNNGLNKKPIIYKITDFPLQRWNNIVINYDGGILDIFMNSKLVASFKNVVPYMSIDDVTVGDDNGIGGGVCNVLYFPRIMSKERIDANYTILKNINPPII